MKLSKRSIVYNAVRDLGGLGLIFVFSGGGFSPGALNILAAGLFAVILLFSFIALLGWEYLVWKNYDYFLEEGQIRILQGVLRKSEREIPLKRIQNVDVRRNIIHRVFDLAKVDLETAGGGSTEASLKYITRERAEQIREHIREEKRVGEEKSGKSGGEEPVYRMSNRNLAIYSATSLDTTTIFGILALMAFILGGAGFAAEDLGLTASVVLAGVLFTGVIVSFLFNFGKNFEQYYGFKLWENEDNLRYERGLFNRQEGTIPLEKIQNLKIEENLLKRPLNFATLKIETAGYSGEKAMKQGSEAAIPLDRRKNVVEFAENLQDFTMPEMNSIAPQSRRRYFGRYLILSAFVLTANYVSRQFVPFKLLPYLLILPLALAASHLKYRNRRYAVSEKNFFTVNGFWNRKTLVVPYYRIQNLIKSQTVFQERFDISTLTVDVAGAGAINGNPVVHDLESRKMEEVKEEIYSRFQESL